MKSTLSLIPVRYAETDQMGVVHHSHYPVYFEAGRTDFFLEHLIPYQECEAQGLYAPVLSLELEILGRASYGDVLRLRTTPGWLRGVRLMMAYSIETGKGSKVATGQTTHALVGPDMQVIHPRGFGSLYRSLQEVFCPAS